MADRTEMFAPTRGFSRMADSMVPCTMLWGRPLLLWQRHFGKFGLFIDKIAHESSCMPERTDMFGPTRGDNQRGRPLLARQRHLRQTRSLIAYRLVIIIISLRIAAMFGSHSVGVTTEQQWKINRPSVYVAFCNHYNHILPGNGIDLDLLL